MATTDLNSGDPFNAAKFLYLQPEFAAYSNVTSPELALQYYQAHSNDNINNAWLWSLSHIPFQFDEIVYLSENRETLNVSGLNGTVRLAMLAEGFTTDELSQNGVFVSTIFRPVALIATNTFRFNIAASSKLFVINESNLNVGDQVKVVRNSIETLSATVTSIPDSQTFVVSVPYFTISDQSSSYEVLGIKIYDPLRLAHIFYLRTLQSSPTLLPPSNTTVDADFNPDLYRLLYPEARIFDNDTAYMDYIGHLENKELRIGRTLDLSTQLDSQYTTTYEDLTIKNRLLLDLSQNNGYVRWNNQDIYYVTTDSHRRSSDCSTVFQGLITEQAIKAYIDRSYAVEAKFNNIQVNGNAMFNNNVHLNHTTTLCNALIQSMVVTDPHATFCNDVYVGSNLEVEGNLRVDDDTFLNANLYVESNLYVQGNVSVSNATYISLQASNITLSNIATDILGHVDIYRSTKLHDTLNVSSNALFSGHVTFCNTMNVLSPATFENSTAFKNATQFDGSVDVNGPTSINNRLYVTGEMTTFNDFKLYGFTYVASPLFVQAPAYFQTSASFDSNCTVDVNGPIKFKGPSNVFATTAYMQAETKFEDQATFDALAVFNDTALFNSNALFSEHVDFNNIVSVNAPLNINNIATFSNIATFNQHVMMNSNTIIKSLTLPGTVVVQSNMVVQGDMHVPGTLALNGSNVVTGSILFDTPYVEFTSNVTFKGPTSLQGLTVLSNGLLDVQEPAIFREIACFSNQVFFDEPTTFRSNVCFYNPVSFSNAVRFVNFANFEELSSFNQTVLFKEVVDFNGPVRFNSNLYLNVIATFCNQVFMDDQVVFNSNVLYKGPTEFSNLVTFDDRVIFKQAVQFDQPVNQTQPSTFYGTLCSYGPFVTTDQSLFQGTTSFNNTAIFTSNVSMQGAMNMSGAMNITGNQIIDDGGSFVTSPKANVVFNSPVSFSNTTLLSDAQISNVSISGSMVLSPGSTLVACNDTTFVGNTEFTGSTTATTMAIGYLGASNLNVTNRFTVPSTGIALFNGMTNFNCNVDFGGVTQASNLTVMQLFKSKGSARFLDAAFSNTSIQNLIVNSNGSLNVFAPSTFNAPLYASNMLIAPHAQILSISTDVLNAKTFCNMHDTILGTLYSESNYLTHLNSSNAFIEVLQALNASFSTMTSSNARLSKVLVDSLNVAIANVGSNYVNANFVSNEQVAQLSASNAQIARAQMSNAYITSLNVDSAIITALHAPIVNVDVLSNNVIAWMQSNVTTNAWIQNASISNATLLNVYASNASLSNLITQTASINTSVNRVIHASNVFALNASINSLQTTSNWVNMAYTSNAFINNLNVNKAAVSNISLVTVNACNISVSQSFIAQSNAIFVGKSTFCNDIQFGVQVTCDSKFVANAGTSLLGTYNYVQNATLCDTKMDGDLQIVSTPTLKSNIVVNGAMMGPRIGIGPYGFTYDESTFHYNPLSNVPNFFSNKEIHTSNLYVDDNLYTYNASVYNLMKTSNMWVDNAATILGNTVIGIDGVTNDSIMLNVHGYIQAENMVATSDKRVKTNIKQAETRRIYDMLSKVDVVSFAFKHSHHEYGKNKLGVIAQDFEQLFPDAVHETTIYEKDLMVVQTGYVNANDLNRILFSEKSKETSTFLEDLEVDMGITIVDKNRKVIKTNITCVSDNAIRCADVLDPGVVKVTHVCYRDVKLVDQNYMLGILLAAFKEMRKEIEHIKGVQLHQNVY